VHLPYPLGQKSFTYKAEPTTPIKPFTNIIIPIWPEKSRKKYLKSSFIEDFLKVKTLQDIPLLKMMKRAVFLNWV